MTEEVKAEHTLAEHQHGGPDCTHVTIQHGDHMDFIHNGHRHGIFQVGRYQRELGC